MWTGLWTGGLGAGDWAVPNYPGHEVRIANLRGVRVCVCVCVCACVRQRQCEERLQCGSLGLARCSVALEKDPCEPL
jgi:hypothetical protein